MNVEKVLVFAFIAFCIHSVDAKPSSRNKLRRAIRFMAVADRNFAKVASEAAHTLWNWQVNLTKHNQNIKDEAAKAASKYGQKIYLKARKFKWRRYRESNETLYRWFELAGKGLSSVESAFYNGKEQTSASSRMSNIFDQVKICPYKESSKECNMTLGKEISKVFASSRNPAELKYYWLTFRKETGEKYKDLFLKSIEEDNQDAKGFGYKNKADYNVAMYEDEEFLENMAREVKKLLPFFKQIHAYVRKKLRTRYKNENIEKDGPIPAHLLGNMYAQAWNNIFPIVKPFPKSKGLPDVTKVMLKKKMNAMDMFIMAERFFVSIGMKKMNPSFWKKSVLTKPKGVNMTCHASAHDFFDGKDYRIKMCTQVNSENLATIHHEMGHIQYYMYYNKLPVIFRRSANPGFHEAIGDAISLSVQNPDYLRQVGLLEKREGRKNKRATINYLMNMALIYGVSPNYAYIIDHWRNQVYNGTIKPKELNKMYWKYRLQYQGICPPAKRTEKNFDIGAKYHIPAGVEYFRYFVASILRFQIHKILCEEAGHKGPLHECNIYKKKKAGKIFSSMLKQGRLKKWKEILSTFSKKKYNKIDASALLEYFKPLLNWLKKKNKQSNEYIGWKSKSPMSCPGSKSDSTAPSEITGSGVIDNDREYFDMAETTVSSATKEKQTDLIMTRSTDVVSKSATTKSADTTVSDYTTGISTIKGSTVSNEKISSLSSDILDKVSTSSAGSSIVSDSGTIVSVTTDSSASVSGILFPRNKKGNLIVLDSATIPSVNTGFTTVSGITDLSSDSSGAVSRTATGGSIVSDSETIPSANSGFTTVSGIADLSSDSSGAVSKTVTGGSIVSDSETIPSANIGFTSVTGITDLSSDSSGAVSRTGSPTVSLSGFLTSAITDSTASINGTIVISPDPSDSVSTTKLTSETSSKTSVSETPVAILITISQWQSIAGNTSASFGTNVLSKTGFTSISGITAPSSDILETVSGTLTGSSIVPNHETIASTNIGPTSVSTMTTLSSDFSERYSRTLTGGSKESNSPTISSDFTESTTSVNRITQHSTDSSNTVSGTKLGEATASTASSGIPGATLAGFLKSSTERVSSVSEGTKPSIKENTKPSSGTNSLPKTGFTSVSGITAPSMVSNPGTIVLTNSGPTSASRITVLSTGTSIVVSRQITEGSKVSNAKTISSVITGSTVSVSGMTKRTSGVIYRNYGAESENSIVSASGGSPETMHGNTMIFLNNDQASISEKGKPSLIGPSFEAPNIAAVPWNGSEYKVADNDIESDSLAGSADADMSDSKTYKENEMVKFLKKWLMS